ncbi:MAG: porin family protein [Gallionella sp.]|nr:porin family protein [Gallionella sp.]
MKKITAILLFSMMAAPAFAANNEGFYVGGTLGNGRLGFTSNVALSKATDFVYGGLFGYRYNQNLAVEAQFTGVGKSTTVTGATLKGDAFSLVAVGILPVSSSVELFGKLGASSTKITAAGFTTQGETRTGVTLGIGGQYSVSPNIAIRAGWDGYPEAVSNAGVKTFGYASVFSVGAIFKF